MREVTQTIYAEPMAVGDCLRAAVASLTDVPYDEVPHFGRWRGWWDAMRVWARARGWDFGCWYVVDGSVRHALPDDPDWAGLMIGSGPSARSGLQHAVIVDRDLELVWDPHPSRAGLRYVDEVFFASALPLWPPPYLPELTAAPAGDELAKGNR